MKTEKEKIIRNIQRQIERALSWTNGWYVEENKYKEICRKLAIKLSKKQLGYEAGKSELIKELRTLHNQKGLSALLNYLGLQEK